MNYYTLSINSLGHDASVALFNRDELQFFSLCERFVREKNTTELHEDEPFKYIYDHITKDIDLLLYYNFGNHGIRKLKNDRIFNKLSSIFNCKEVFLRENWPSNAQAILEERPSLENFSHHCGHAISAFYMSPFDDAVCLIIDAIGSEYIINQDENPMFGVIGNESTSIVEIDNTFQRKYLYKKSNYYPVGLANRIPSFTNVGGLMCHAGKSPKEYFDRVSYKFDASTHMDIGNIYKIICKHLGFRGTESGKVMGLSAYGNPNNSLPKFLIGDTILFDKNLFCDGREINYFLHPELFGDLSFQQRADLAYEVQKSLEKIFLYHAEFILKNSKKRNLVIGGGCALNILGVSAIKQKYPEFNIFVDPIAHDGTQSIGTGIHIYNLIHMNGNLKKRNTFNSIYLGPKYDENMMRHEIEGYIKKYNAAS